MANYFALPNGALSRGNWDADSGWQAPVISQDADGKTLAQAATPEQVSEFFSKNYGFDPNDRQVMGDESVWVKNTKTGQYEPGVAAGEGGDPMPLSVAQQNNLPIYQYLKKPNESGSQFGDLAKVVGSVAAMAAGGNLIGNGINLLPGLGGSTGGLVNGTSSLAGSGAGYTPGLTVGPGPISSVSDLASGFGSGLSTGGVTGLTTGAGTGLTSLADLAAGGLGAGLSTGGIGLQTGATGLGAGVGAPADINSLTNATTNAGTGGTTPTTPTTPSIPGGGAGTTAGTTALSRVLNGIGTAADYANVLGTVLTTGLGVVGSNNQTSDLKELANKYLEFGAPSRARYEGSYAPGFDLASADPAYKGALDSTMQATLRKLSTQGNPFGNPGGLIEANKAVVNGTALPALDEYRRLNAGTGGLATLNAAAPAAATAAIGSGANTYNAIGAGIADLTKPQSSLSDLLKRYGGLSLA